MTDEIRTISVEQFAEKRRSGESVTLIDVRTPVEYREVHADLAENIPLASLDPQTVISARSGTEDPVYLICKSGTRATKAGEKFIHNGFTNVLVVEGGTDTWQQMCQPVVLGQKIVSLERQVRVAAGALVLLGLLLGLWVHGSFLGLSAFVGAGLVFAGVTNTCGMALVLARMPWNQPPGGSPCPLAAGSGE